MVNRCSKTDKKGGVSKGTPCSPGISKETTVGHLKNGVTIGNLATCKQKKKLQVVLQTKRRTGQNQRDRGEKKRT